MNNYSTTLPVTDEQLWRQSLAGDREAFGRIVERYQALICSLAYSACGNLARSEDLAQETFVTAWQKLSELREPAKLRYWLCGIVRNLAANSLRREQRRGGPAESLDLIAEPIAEAADPAAHAVTHEEETLLWRSLAGLPETYREPMVLFYRQGQSVAEVATGLELSEDAVKQRLSRGRTLLREEMTALVESTLSRSRPGTAFTLGVLVALPMVSASAATVVTAAGTVASASTTTGKGILAKLGLGMFVGPLIGLTFAYLGTKAAASTARSPEERRYVLRYARWIIAFCLVMSLGFVGVLTQAGKLYVPTAGWLVFGISVWTVALVGGILLICQRMDREVLRIRQATNTTDDPHAKTLAAQGKQLGVTKYFQSKTHLLGLPLFAMSWGGYNSDRYRARKVCAWIAIGDVAISPLLACGGLTIAPISVGAISIGILSLSVFWGAAIGVLAFGSVAFGWWAIGCAAAGIKAAVGFAAIARDYSLGLIASASEANTAAAKSWFKTQWPADFHHLFVQQWPWWMIGCGLLALALHGWYQRQPSRG